MGETRPMKMVSRNVAIVLGLICIILIASIAYFTVTSISAKNSYDNLQNQNRQLQTWLDGNETLLNQTQDNNTNLQNIVNLNESEVVWTESELENYLRITGDLVLGPFEYAGYISVKISATADLSVELNYTFQSLNYSSRVDCGTNGTAIFPVMPSSFLFIRPDATVPPAGWTGNWTWTYYY
jgi:cell division protein FtsB